VGVTGFDLAPKLQRNVTVPGHLTGICLCQSRILQSQQQCNLTHSTLSVLIAQFKCFETEISVTVHYNVKSLKWTYLLFNLNKTITGFKENCGNHDQTVGMCWLIWSVQVYFKTYAVWMLLILSTSCKKSVNMVILCSLYFRKTKIFCMICFCSLSYHCIMCLTLNFMPLESEELPYYYAYKCNLLVLCS
jgi:hypothetical protein